MTAAMTAGYQQQAQALQSNLGGVEDRYLEDLFRLCMIETKSGHAAGIDETVAALKDVVKDRGWTVKEWPDEEAGAGISFTVDGGNPDGLRLALVGHHDTVFPVGTVDERPPARVGDKITGPGVIDMKSGLLSSLYAMAALEDLDLLGRFATISLITTPDEEADMRVSKVILEEIAPHYDVALSVEAANPDGSIVISRKGGMTFTATVAGKAAHASRPHHGANAIHALAQQVSAMQSLNGFRPGVTVNVGIIRGGTADNSVPDSAEAIVDVRMTGEEGDDEAILAAFDSIGRHPYVYGTTSTVERTLYFPAMHSSDKIITLADLAVSVGKEFGMEVAYGPRGGITLANLLAGHGLPTLDGLGPIGGAEHSVDEYLDVPSIVPRIELLALFSYSVADSFVR